MEMRTSPMEVRASGRKAVGYAATFGAVADLGGGLTEIISPGAFANSLKTNPDILALLDHNTSAVLGRTRSGSLKLSEDNRGLHFELDIPATRAGDDVIALAERGDLGGCSFGFFTPKGGDSWQGSKRTLNKVDLREISIVQSVAAYPDTEIALRHYDRIRDHWRRRYVLILAEQDRWRR